MYLLNSNITPRFDTSNSFFLNNVRENPKNVIIFLGYFYSYVSSEESDAYLVQTNDGFTLFVKVLNDSTVENCFCHIIMNSYRLKLNNHFLLKLERSPAYTVESLKDFSAALQLIESTLIASTMKDLLQAEFGRNYSFIVSNFIRDYPNDRFICAN